ncbi:MAG: YebC/PmpR family DNA-binding transcriptional regulator [Candidatus Cloacimonadota bacterium]|nr:MAG: YebC/PmpR family DNA-binding transcriptional regulator [Candidatus Cloacimonadota bacterium]
MSGHSKWSTIRRKKEKIDAKRGRIFTRLIKEITIAAREGGGDADANPRLRAAIATAKAENMPNDNIERAVKKGTGELPGVSYEETHFECYGPDGVAILIEVLTDNKNRTTAEIRHILTKHGGSMGETGSVIWMFHQKGLIHVEKDDVDEDKLLEISLDGGAEDVSLQTDIYEITTEPSHFEEVKKLLEKAKYKILRAEMTKAPQSTIRVKDAKSADKIIGLMEDLEEHEDIQHVYANFDITDEILDSIS